MSPKSFAAVPLALASWTLVACAAPRLAAWPPSFAESLAEGRLPEAEAALSAAADPGARLRAELALAEREHDGARLARALESPALASLRRSPQGHAELAFARYRVEGLLAAGAELRALCARSDGEARVRGNACALATQAALAAGRPTSVAGPDQATIPLLGDGPIALIKVSVNGLPPALFAFDTGAEASVLTRQFCEKNQVPFLSGVSRVGGDAGGRDVKAWPAVVDRFQAGDLEIRNLPVTVIDLPPQIPLAGILAPYDAFPGRLVEIDRRAKVLRVHRGLTAEAWRAAAGEPVYEAACQWFEENGFHVLARVNDARPGLFLLDTGANETGLLKGEALALGFSLEKGKAETGAGAAGDLGYVTGFEGTLAVGDAPAGHSAFVVTDRPAVKGLHRQGSIGWDWTTGRRIAIPPDGRRILFTAPAK